MSQETTPMSPDKWERIKNIFEEVLSAPVWERNPTVKRLCDGDNQLEAEVCKLLEADEHAGGFLEVPVFAGFIQGHRQEFEGLGHVFQLGKTVSERFQIQRFVNKGGMGEVYEAWDSELNDRVALKTIRPEIASNPLAIARFKFEVKQARGVSHPNICRVYDLFSHQDRYSQERIWFLTMEFLEGETLLDRVRTKGTLSIEDALALTEQMVAGLTAAHRCGVVHRDFKSGNVMLVETAAEKTRAVITDFGLARTISAADSRTSEPAGQGTPDYMAPEQRVGGEVGFAADQYALGVVICEMLTGERPEIKNSSPLSLSIPDHKLAPRWQAVIRRCLELRPEDRFSDVGEIIAILNPRQRRNKIAWQISVVSILALIATGAVFFNSSTNEQERLQGVTQLTASTDLSSEPSLSRDGKVIAYMSDRAEAGNLDIWVQRLPSGTPLRLTTNAAADGDPDLAPDGKSVIFHSDRDGGGIYWSSTETSGREHLLVPHGRGGRFSPDGQYIAYWVGDEDKSIASGQLYLLSLSGGPQVRIAADFKDARLPAWSSDGRYLLFTACRAGEQPMSTCSEWWVTNRDGSSLQNTGALTMLRARGILPKGPIAGWIGNSVLFCARHEQTTSLWRLHLSETNRLAAGAPLQLTSGYATNVTEASSLAENGSIAFSRLSSALHIWRIDNSLGPHPRNMTKITDDAAIDISPFISHSGRWLVFCRGSATLHNIWIKDIRSGTESLAFSSANDKTSPIISESGDKVIYEERSHESTSIFMVHRGHSPKLLCTSCGKPTSWFSDERSVLYRAGNPSKIKIMALETGQSKTAIESYNMSLSEATWSPENEFLLFTASLEGGLKQIYAVHFPRSTGTATGSWIPVGDPSGSSDRARWSGDGRSIFYRSSIDGFPCIWAQRFDPLSKKTVGRPSSVMHFHNIRLSPQAVTPPSFELSASNDSVYLNLAEVSASIWTGLLNARDLTSSDWRER